jgi:hypothetical protein
MATSIISASIEANRAEDHANQLSLSVWTPVFPIFAAWSARLGPTFIRRFMLNPQVRQALPGRP